MGAGQLSSQIVPAGLHPPLGLASLRVCLGVLWGTGGSASLGRCWGRPWAARAPQAVPTAIGRAASPGMAGTSGGRRDDPCRGRTGAARTALATPMAASQAAPPTTPDLLSRGGLLLGRLGLPVPVWTATAPCGLEVPGAARSSSCPHWSTVAVAGKAGTPPGARQDPPGSVIHGRRQWTPRGGHRHWRAGPPPVPGGKGEGEEGQVPPQDLGVLEVVHPQQGCMICN